MSATGRFYGGPKSGDVTEVQEAFQVIKVIKPPKIDFRAMDNEPIEIITGYYKRVHYDISRGYADYYWQGWEDGSK